MKSISVSQFLVVGLIMGLCGQVHAERRGKPGAIGPKRMGKIIKKLGVDEAIQTKIKSVVFESRKKTIGLKAKRDEQRLELEQMMSVSEPERSAVMQMIEQIGQTTIAMRKLRVGTMLTIRSMLTPEQRTELTILMERRRSRQGHKRGHRKGPRDRALR